MILRCVQIRWQIQGRFLTLRFLRGVSLSFFNAFAFKSTVLINRQVIRDYFSSEHATRPDFYVFAISGTFKLSVNR